MSDKLKQDALEYHEYPVPGKISVTPTKPCETQKELALAYTPGVAEPVRAIVSDPQNAYRYTDKGNLVAVISNGTAVLGLGNTGPLASKPVLEGKAVLFKRFANIDVFDIEVDADGIDEFIDTVRRIAPTFGGINLEDIAAPACFEIERRLEQELDIPVFHDDQHGTAVIICAGLLNALELADKKLDDARIVCLGAGAAGISSMRLLRDLGANEDKLFMVDSKGVVRAERDDLNEYKREFARATELRALEEVMRDADVFIGVSSGGKISKDMVKSMAERPIVFALANPEPEIRPEIAREVRDDVIMATGRSDYPNQVNNVLGFPFIFRGALDVHASHITVPMLKAAVTALRDLAREPVPADVLKAYGVDTLEFGPDYIIPKPLDPRLIDAVAPAVARAAIASGVARQALPEDKQG
ncbi:MAG: malic enzyme-like NAD(P)-binding protein [Acidiferrobacteraceae bacterium]|jgi:malate dehydrogenase (oxaloacetate-decarboxylating)(NADP+)